MAYKDLTEYEWLKPMQGNVCALSIHSLPENSQMYRAYLALPDLLAKSFQHGSF